MVTAAELIADYQTGDVFYHPDYGVKCILRQEKVFKNGKEYLEPRIVKYKGRKEAINSQELIPILLNMIKKAHLAIEVRRDEISSYEEEILNLTKKFKKMGIESEQVEHWLKNGYSSKPTRSTRTRRPKNSPKPQKRK